MKTDFFLFGALVTGLVAGRQTPCPATQPGLIVRDSEHPPSARPPDREYVVIVGQHMLQVGLNRVQAEGIAAQLKGALPGVAILARPQIAVEAEP